MQYCCTTHYRIFALVRIMVAILSIYLTSLSVFPCADGLISDSCDMEVHLHNADDGENHDDSTDTCTPLCGCQCCGANITVHPSINNNLVNLSIADLHAAYIAHFGKECCNTPFQPPQV